MTILRVDKSLGGWESVPRRLFDDDRLSIDTRGVAGFLATRTNNFTLSAAGLKKLLGMGKAKWERIAKELEAGGYLERINSRDDDGRYRWEMVFRPEPIGGFPSKNRPKPPYQPQVDKPPVAEPPVVQPPAAGATTTVDLINTRDLDVQEKPAFSTFVKQGGYRGGQNAQTALEARLQAERDLWLNGGKVANG